jgi:hypothetical protein
MYLDSNTLKAELFLRQDKVHNTKYVLWKIVVWPTVVSYIHQQSFTSREWKLTEGLRSARENKNVHKYAPTQTTRMREHQTTGASNRWLPECIGGLSCYSVSKRLTHFFSSGPQHDTVASRPIAFPVGYAITATCNAICLTITPVVLRCSRVQIHIFTIE